MVRKLNTAVEVSVRFDLQITSNFYFSDAGDTPLHYAARQGKAGSANCLLQHGADLGAANKAGNDPMQCARLAGHPKLMQGLSSSGTLSCGASALNSTA